MMNKETTWEKKMSAKYLILQIIILQGYCFKIIVLILVTIHFDEKLEIFLNLFCNIYF